MVYKEMLKTVYNRHVNRPKELLQVWCSGQSFRPRRDMFSIEGVTYQSIISHCPTPVGVGAGQVIANPIMVHLNHDTGHQESQDVGDGLLYTGGVVSTS